MGDLKKPGGSSLGPPRKVRYWVVQIWVGLTSRKRMIDAWLFASPVEALAFARGEGIAIGQKAAREEFAGHGPEGERFWASYAETRLREIVLDEWTSPAARAKELGLLPGATRLLPGKGD